MLAGGVSKTKTEILHEQGFTEIRFHTGHKWGKAIIFLFMLGAWFFGGLFAVVMLSATSDADPMFFIVWLSFWGFGGFFVLLTMLWSILGSESLIASAQSLTLMRRLLFLKFPLVIPAIKVKDLRWIADDPNRTVTVNNRRIPQTALEINTVERFIKCAHGIGKIDADIAIAAIKQRLVVPLRRR